MTKNTTFRISQKKNDFELGMISGEPPGDFGVGSGGVGEVLENFENRPKFCFSEFRSRMKSPIADPTLARGVATDTKRISSCSTEAGYDLIWGCGR